MIFKKQKSTRNKVCLLDWRVPTPQVLLVALILIGAPAFLSGCSNEPTFPEDKIMESIVSISKDLYGAEVIAADVGNTIGLLYYTDTIVNETGTAISQEVSEKIGQLSQVVTRVGLSTNKDVQFTVVAVRGRKEGLELKIIRYLDDIKRAYAEALSTTESMARTVFDQLQYDRAAAEEKTYKLEPLTLEQFLTFQVLQRVRYSTTPDKETATTGMPQVLFDGTFREADDGKRFFEFSILTLEKEQAVQNIRNLLEMLRDVIPGYQYSAYDFVIIRDLLNLKILRLDRGDLELYQKNKIGSEDLIKQLKADTDRSKLFKEALEVFDYTQSPEA